MATSQRGFLLIADITGYTMYLSQSELEHAQGVLSALLELLIEQTRAPLVISRLAGDAVISYALDATLHGQTFVENLEQTFVAFRKALERMSLNNHSCGCNACANIHTLDLKFFVHHGTFAVQHLGAHDELVGSDVNLIHRLLKNRVVEATGIRAYTLYTEAALGQLGLIGFQDRLVPHAESYEHLGEVRAWIQDMGPVWEEKRSEAVLRLRPQEVLRTLSTRIDLPPRVVWDFTAQPEHRAVLNAAERQEVRERTEDGRIGPGSVYLCYHGNEVIPEMILEWQPFERILTQTLLPIPVPETYMLVELRLEPQEGGTRFTQTFSRARGSWLGRVIADVSLRVLIAWRGKKDLERFARHVEREAQERAEAIRNPEVLVGAP